MLKMAGFLNIQKETAVILLIFVFLVTDIFCYPFNELLNGQVYCILGNNGIPDPGDSCYFMCNSGFKLQGNSTRICQDGGIWSAVDVTCTGVYA